MAGTLGYFSSLILAPIYAVLGSLAGVDQVRAHRGTQTSTRQSPKNRNGPLSLVFWRSLAELTQLWMLGIALLLVGMMWNRNCDPVGGLGYFVMGPVFSSVVGITCGILGGLCRERRRAQIFAALLPFCASTLVGLLRLYFDPVVFAFDPFWGWFSGPIYDESVGIDTRYLKYRAYNSLWVASLALFATAVLGPDLRARSPSPRGFVLRLSIALALALLGTTVYLESDVLGFTATHSSLKKHLSRVKTTEHFEIHYAPRSATAREIDAISAEHEFAWSRLESMLGRAPAGRVRSYIFNSTKQRRRLLGAGRPEVSLPWKGEMYLSHLAFPHRVLHHELAHAFLGSFGDPVFGLSISGTRINVGLIEGVPTALAPRSAGYLDLHDQAAVLDRLRRRPRMTAVMGLGFWAQSSSRAYTAAGSFILWLRNTHGATKVAELYGNAGDFQATYGTGLPALEEAWVTFLRARPLRERDVASMDQRFKRKSVFRRPCAHRAAALSARASKARRAGRFADAIESLESLCRIEPERHQHKIGLAHALAEQGRFGPANDVLVAAAAMPEPSDTLLARIDEHLGDVAMYAGDFEQALSHYRAGLHRGISESRRRVLQIKQSGAVNPELSAAILGYFSPFDSLTRREDQAVRRMYYATILATEGGDSPRESSAIGRYLSGVQLMHIRELPEARRQFQAALASVNPSLPTNELRRAAHQRLMNVELRLGNFTAARAQRSRLEADFDNGNGHRLDLANWRDRIDFFSEYKLR